MTAVNCEEVVRLLWLYMDRELEPEAARRLAEHVRACRDCGSRHAFEARLRAIIREKCAGRAVPEPLRRRLMNLLHTP